MLAEYEEVDEVHHQLAENDGELVPRNERAADSRRGHLGDIHGADSRCQANSHATYYTVDVEGHQKAERGLAVVKEEEFRIVAAESRHEEEYARNNERGAASEVPGKVAGNGAADDAAYEGARRGEAMDHVGVHEILRTEEEGLEAFLGTGNHGSVVAEQESAQHCHCHYRE